MTEMEKNLRAAGLTDAHRAHACGCGHDHPHAPLTAEEMRRLQRQKKALERLKAGARRLQALHDKIDAALAQVTQQNIGLLLTQKKTLRQLEKEADALFASGFDHPMLQAMEIAEREYIERIGEILHEAQLLHRAKRGNVTPEVVRNLVRATKPQPSA